MIVVVVNPTSRPYFYFIRMFAMGLDIDKMVGLDISGMIGLAIGRAISSRVDVNINFFGLSL